MFEELTSRLKSTVQRVRGQGRVTEDNVADTLREVRVALLEADVALPVVRQFVQDVKSRAVGTEVVESLTPGQALIKIVHDELVQLMGRSNEGLNLAARPPAVVMLAGLQGSGKTTTAGKLARRLRERDGKRVMVVSTDIYRPAAIDQLRKLASEVDVAFHPSDPGQRPVDIATGALEQARGSQFDVLIIDTAGRMHVDQAMMEEAQGVHAAVSPVEMLFVVDSTTGQDAVTSARAFDAALPLTGVILTKTDGDARGGAALSVRQVTGKPIKFLGIGERSDALEPFHPERVASRILGMGDVVSLVEQVEEKADRAQAEKLARKLRKGKGFDLEDFRDQVMQIERMGGLASLVEKLPGMGPIPAAALNQVDGRQVGRLVAIINAMTPHERTHPDIIRASRKRRIASGSGTQVQDVNRLLRQFTQMQKMMKRMGKGGQMQNMLRGMGGRRPGRP